MGEKIKIVNNCGKLDNDFIHLPFMKEGTKKEE